MQKRWAGIGWTEANNTRIIQPAHPTIYVKLLWIKSDMLPLGYLHTILVTDRAGSKTPLEFIY